MTGKEWLALNDPQYVAPQKKAAQTRKVAYSQEALEAMAGSQSVKVNGRYVQVNPIAFVGEGEVGIAVNPGEVKRSFVESPVRRRGKRGGRKH